MIASSPLRALSVVLSCAIAAVSFAACGDEPTAQRCTEIPAGGCPLSRGLACADPACEAAYACRAGNVWELVERCPPRVEAGAPDAADAGRSWDAAVDAPEGANGGPGCGVLQAPDCALGFVLSCGSCCGCEDLFVCARGAWELWGACGAAGPVPSR